MERSTTNLGGEAEMGEMGTMVRLHHYVLLACLYSI